VLVTGATGLLGRAVVAALTATGAYEVVGTAFSRARDGVIRLDLRDGGESQRAVVALKPAVVINTAAERRPDVVEADDAGSEALNVESVWHLGRAAAYVDAAFIHISTDYIFDGTASPYAEDAPTAPLNTYGRQKVRGEHAALAAHPAPFILRVPVLFGPTADPAESAITVFVAAVRDAAAPRALDDWQVRVPTYTPDVARTLTNVVAALLARGSPSAAASAAPRGLPPLAGIYHYSSADYTTRYAVARLMAEVLHLPADHLTPDAGPPPGAPRPRDVRLNTAKLTATGLAAPCTPLRDALAAVLLPPS